MHLALVGLNQLRAPVAVRGTFAVAPAELAPALDGLRGRVDEALVLSTCNRIEVYTVAPSIETALRAARSYLASRNSDLWPDVAARAYEHDDADAVRHLFEVASGLDSVILGEPQILGQLRHALEVARAERLSGPVLGQVGAAAVACAKRVRAETGIGRLATSIVSVALREAERQLGGWARRRVVIVGAGATAELVLKHLAGQDGMCLTVIGRTSERATALAQRHGAAARAFSELRDALAGADAVIACTAAPHHVVSVHDLIAAGRQRDERRLVCVDLGVPRDFDSGVTALPAVRLIDLDGVQAIADRHRAMREREGRQAQLVVEREIQRFMNWWRARNVIPTIARMRADADALREAELTRALARLPHLAAHEARVVRGLARRLVSKLLHAPTITLRERGDLQLAAAIRTLFALADDEGSAPATPNKSSNPRPARSRGRESVET